MTVNRKKSKVKNPSGNSEEFAIHLQEQIRRRAYELYERRGRNDGHETEDWLAAEAQLTGERTLTLATETVKTNRKPAAANTGKINAKQIKKSRSSAPIKAEEQIG